MENHKKKEEKGEQEEMENRKKEKEKGEQ